MSGIQFVTAASTLRATQAIDVTQAAHTSLASSATAISSPVRSASGFLSPQVLSGAGALVAFIDTGVDVFHQDFRRNDGTTRIKALLDLSDPGDIDGDGDLDGIGPFGGTLHTEAQINAALLSGSLRQRDSTGHGTHGLSIAAGDDAAFPGMAPRLSPPRGQGHERRRHSRLRLHPRRLRLRGARRRSRPARVRLQRTAVTTNAKGKDRGGKPRAQVNGFFQ